MEDFGSHLGLGAHDEAVVVTDDFKKFFGLESGIHVHGNFRGGAESVHAFF
jgi:hypothetical protein